MRTSTRIAVCGALFSAGVAAAMLAAVVSRAPAAAQLPTSAVVEVSGSAAGTPSGQR